MNGPDTHFFISRQAPPVRGEMDYHFLHQSAINNLNYNAFERSMFLNCQPDNLVSEWGGVPFSCEDNKMVEISKSQPLADRTNFQFIGSAGNHNYSYQPYRNFDVATGSQAQDDKCGFVTGQAFSEYDSKVHFKLSEFIKEEPQPEILDLDSRKVVPFQTDEEDEDPLFDRPNFSQDIGNQSPDFGCVSTTMSSPSSSEITPLFDLSQMMQLNSLPLAEYPPAILKAEPGAWKSNETRISRKHHCVACNKSFTSSGHLKRHYNTTLHKNAVIQSVSPEPPTLLMYDHHYPPLLEEKFFVQPDLSSQQEELLPHYPSGIPNFSTSFINPLPNFCHYQRSPNSSSFPGIKREMTSADKAVMETPEVTSSEQPVIHQCVECDKTFSRACYLTQHNKSLHSGNKPYKCQRCGKRFTDEYLLLEHVAKHTGDKEYKCDMCPKQFNHKTDLRRHMCHHSEDKPYPCDFCGKAFIRKDHMLKHAETHKKKSISTSYKKMDNNFTTHHLRV